MRLSFLGSNIEKKLWIEIFEFIIYSSHASNTSFSFGVGGGSFVKYGWLSDWEAVNRMLGSRAKIDRSKDMASLGAAVNISSKGIAGTSSQSNPRAQSGRALWSGQFVSFGVPNTVKIVSSCEMSEFFPCKKAVSYTHLTLPTILLV